MSTPNNPTKYAGTDQYITPSVIRNRRPTTADFKQPETGNYYPVGCIWQVGLTKGRGAPPTPPLTGEQGELWILSKIVANSATWVLFAGGASTEGPVLTLSDDANTEVQPTDLGNIQLVGTPHEVAVLADPDSNSLIISQPNGVPIAEITTDVTGPVFPTNAGLVAATGATSTFTAGPGTNTFRTEVQGTNHALKVGRGSQVASVDLGVGATGTVLIGSTGADPSFSATPAVTSISFDSGTNNLSRFVNTTTFTPTIFGSTSAGTATYSEQTGRYSIIGNILMYTINFAWTGHTGTGDMMIGGFPFAFGAGLSFYPGNAMLQNIVFPASTLWVNVDGVNSTTTAEVVASLDNAAFAAVQMDAAGSLHCSGWYPLA